MRRTIMGLLLGAWLAGTLLTGIMAAENFWIIDRLLNSSANALFHQTVARLPAGEGRVLLRYLASEYNRFWFSVWGWVELALAIILLAMAAMWPPSSSVKYLRLGFFIMLAITVLMAFWLTPEIVQVGRQMDFVPREPPPPAMALFGRLHGLYSILDLVKLAVGFWMVALLIRAHPSRDR